MMRFLHLLLITSGAAVVVGLGVTSQPKTQASDPTAALTRQESTQDKANKIAIDASGRLKTGDAMVQVGSKLSYRQRARRHQLMRNTAVIRKRRVPADTQLCKSLQKVIKERKCARRGVEAVHETADGLVPIDKWPLAKFPLAGCDLPKLLQEAEVKRANPLKCTFAFLTSIKKAEKLWTELPAGGVSVVRLRNSPGAGLVRSESEGEDAEGFVWQSLYQITSTLYFPNLRESDVPELKNLDFGMPNLQFATFMPGHALLQKADYVNDVQLSNGSFWKLANEFGTDKIDHSHNYSLLYHRHLDGGVFKEQGSMMLEIGLGCILERGNAARAGASAKIWPRLLPNTQVHFIEIDRECTAHWEPQRRDAGVAKVHVGPQGDAAVLADVIHDAKFATPGGFCSVVDDGSHDPIDIETSFRSLFPHLKSGGLYFVEDIDFSTWQAYWNYRLALKENEEIMLRTKTDRTSATPTALAAILAAAVTGVAEVPPTATVEEFVAPTAAPDTSFFGPISDAVNSAIAGVMEPFVQAKFPRTRAVPSSLHPKQWRKEILSSVANLVDFVECSPGICVFRRK